MKKMLQSLKGKKGQKGFTLIELLVVIAILAILVLLAAPRFLGYTKDANVATMQADAKVLSNAALVYNIENDTTWPVAEGASTVATLTQTGGDTIKVVAIDETKIASQIQNLKGDIADYGIVVDDTSDNAGSVYHLTGVDDRDGDKHFGVNLVDTAAEETADNITVTPITVTP